MLGGPASGRLQHTGIVLSYAMFPPALLLMLLAVERRSILLGAAFGATAAILALGRNHESLLLCFVLAALLIAELARRDDAGRWRLEGRGPILAAMAVVGFAVLVVPLLLTLQFAALSNRPTVSLADSLEGSLYPANLATMAVANVMGSLETTATYWGPNFDTLPEVGATDRSHNYLFVGAATTILLLWFGIAGGGLARRGRRMFTAVMVVALLYMLGRYTPFYALAFQYVPGIDLFRRPLDAAFVFVAALAILAGYLLDDYVREGLPRPPAWRVALVGLGAVAVVAWAIVFAQRSNRGWDAAWEALKMLPVAVAIIGGLACARSAKARAVAASMVAILAAAELVWFNAASSLNAEPPGYYAPLQQPTGEDAAALAVLEREVKALHALGVRPRVEVIGVSGSWQNLAMTRGLEATNGYNPLRIGRYDRLVSPGETTYIVDQREFPASFDGYDCALARELGLEFVVLGQPIEKMPHLAKRPVADVLVAGPKVWIYRLTDPEPRVKFLARIVVADTDFQVMAGLFGVNPASEVALIDVDTAPSRMDWPMIRSRENNFAHIVSWSPDRVEIEVDSAQPGVLLLHDTYYPGWIVEVDGQQANLLRANVLFRGVEVGEGRHRVVFRYAPLSLQNLRDALVGAIHGMP
jgi:hypothetical protein